jgi:protein tyrosine/serine phosphatase
MNEDIINEKSIELLNSLRSSGLQTPDIVEVLKKALSIHGVIFNEVEFKIVDLDPEFSKILDEHFDSLIDNKPKRKRF